MNALKNALGAGHTETDTTTGTGNTAHHNASHPTGTGYGANTGATGTGTGYGANTGTTGTGYGATTGTGATGTRTGTGANNAEYNATHTAGQKLESHVPGTQQNRERKMEQGTAGTGVTGAHTSGHETVTTRTTINADRDSERAIADRQACDTKFYTSVEDRPVVKEHVDVIREHRPVEKEFVVETRLTGREKTLARPADEIIDEKTRIVSEHKPSPCEGAPRI